MGSAGRATQAGDAPRTVMTDSGGASGARQFGGSPGAWVRQDSLAATAVALTTFAIYVAGAARTIYVGDSGELVTAVATLGIPHPSGYPLYVLLGKAFTLAIPFGSIAFRMSLFSAVCAALSCAVAYALARAWSLRRDAAFLAAGLLAFSPSFWSQANIQRVYSLNALFVVTATLAATRWLRGRRDSQLAVAFLLCGLGAANHTFMALYAVALGVYVTAVDLRVLVEPASFARRALTVFGPFFVGLLPYAYLPLRSRMNPRLDWGDPETFAGFRDVVLRDDFWERAWMESASDWWPILTDYAGSLATELAWVGAALALVGAAVGMRRGVPVFLLLSIMLANVLAIGLHGSRSDIFIWHRYYIPSYICATMLAAAGWDLVSQRLPARACAAVIALPLALLISGHRDFDRSRYRIAEDFARTVLDAIPPGAHLIATDDNVLFALMYLHLVERERPDVNLVMQGVGNADLPPLRFDPDSEPLYFTHHPNWDLPALEIVPMGVVYQARRRGGPLPDAQVSRMRLDGELDEKVPKDYLTRNLIGHFHYTLGFAFERRDWLQARAAFAEAAAAAPDNDVMFYNLGLIYARNGLFEEALEFFERSDQINPRHLASSSRPHAAEKISRMREEIARLARVTADSGLAPRPDTVGGWSPSTHETIATLLDSKGESVAARGHRLLALEKRSERP